MLTRETVWHSYLPMPVRRYVRDGAVRQTMYKRIPQTWAVSRPTSSYDPSGTPFYFAGTDRPSGALVVSGFQGLKLPPEKVEADPSDPTTWRRPYRFT